MKTDVLVIGAGVAGLTCARALRAIGVTTLVLEARNRVGGRILTLRHPGEEPVELGAQVVHGDRAATWQVIRWANLRTAPLPPSGEVLFSVDGRVLSLADLQRMRAPLPWTVEQRLTHYRPADRPVAEILPADGGEGLSQTLALEWLAQTWCADPASLSPAGMKRVREGRNSGEQEFKILDGYDRVTDVLAGGLTVRLQSAARVVCWRPGRVTVDIADERYEAQAAVVTVPPGVVASGSLQFDPPLPNEKANAAGAIGAGAALVVIARQAKPAPRSVWALVAGRNGGLWFAEAGSRVLRGWIKGPAAARIGKMPVRSEDIAELSGGAFPWLEPGTVTDIHEVNWTADPFALGGFSFPRAGKLDVPARWAAPLAGALFFAGEATSERHLGMVHGALESGLRAAREVAAMLQE